MGPIYFSVMELSYQKLTAEESPSSFLTKDARRRRERERQHREGEGESE
jgi:hypothetical protein